MQLSPTSVCWAVPGSVNQTGVCQQTRALAPFLISKLCWAIAHKSGSVVSVLPTVGWRGFLLPTRPTMARFEQRKGPEGADCPVFALPPWLCWLLECSANPEVFSRGNPEVSQKSPWRLPDGGKHVVQLDRGHCLLLSFLTCFYFHYANWTSM